MKQGPRAGVESTHHKTVENPFLRSAEFCGTCHNEKAPWGLWVKASHLEWKDGPHGRAGIVCQDCHMPPAAGLSAAMGEQYLKGFSPREAGVVLVAQPVVMAAFSPLAGRLSDRIEPRIVASIGMGFTALGLGLFAFLDAGSPLWFIVLSLVVIGFGFALFSSPNTSAVMSSIDRRSYGVGSAMLGTMRLTGQMLSMGFVMVLFALIIGRERITPDLYPLFLKSLKAAFLLSAVLCAAGIFASLTRGRVHGGPGRS